MNDLLIRITFENRGVHLDEIYETVYLRDTDFLLYIQFSRCMFGLSIDIIDLLIYGG